MECDNSARASNAAHHYLLSAVFVEFIELGLIHEIELIELFQPATWLEDKQAEIAPQCIPTGNSMRF